MSLAAARRQHLSEIGKQAGLPGLTLEDEGFLRLVGILSEFSSVCVAFSGGLDSTFLLRVASSLLGDRVLGVLAASESLDQGEHRAALTLAREHDLPVRVLETHEYDNPEYRKNDAQRCFHCKNELFSEVRKLAAREGFDVVADGSNADDVGDFRPGLRARDGHAVRSPLLEAGLAKESIRRLSLALGLPTWDKPAAPCLASRIPYGSPVTHEKLRQVEAAEKALRELGFRELRVRHHGTVARLELPVSEFQRLLGRGLQGETLHESVVGAVKAAGFLFVALDLEGFRSGSLNRALPEAQV